MNVNDAWLTMLHGLLEHGEVVAPRGLRSCEALALTTRVDLRNPVLTVRERRLGYRFMPAEAAWILSGDNRLRTIEPFSRRIADFSDDGVTFFGAYGPPFVDQISYAVRALVDDPESRQAVITIWRPRPGPTRDVPCTVALQWLIRGGRLHCLASMRSSDAWLGWPYDVFNFSMGTALVALLLRRFDVHVEPGTLYLTAGSQHLYEPQWQAARDLLHRREAFEVAPLDLDEFTDHDHLIDHLWAIAHRDRPGHVWPGGARFLTDLPVRGAGRD